MFLVICFLLNSIVIFAADPLSACVAECVKNFQTQYDKGDNDCFNDEPMMFKYRVMNNCSDLCREKLGLKSSYNISEETLDGIDLCNKK